MKKLLVIDDEMGSRESLKEIFNGFYDVVCAENAMEGLAILSKQRVDLIILDMVMPGMDGLSFLKETRDIYPDVPVIMVSASSAEKSSKEALGIGALGFVSKPFDVYEFRNFVEQALNASEAPRQKEILAKEVIRDFPMFNMVGQSLPFQQVVNEARKASQTDNIVVIYGERGTGKEYLARQIHSWSSKNHEPFVPIHSGVIPPALLDVEIFGTVDVAQHPEGNRGGFDLAGEGSIFIDELHRLSATAQHLLAEVIVSKGYTRNGSQKVVPTNARIFVTLNESIEEKLADKSITRELAEALKNAFVIRIPALRDRPEDVPLLAYHFLNQLRPTLEAVTMDIEPEAMQKLRDYTWPGNIRELKNVIERLLVLYKGERCLRATFLPKEFSDYTQSEEGPDFEAAVNSFERQLIVNALRRSNGVVRSAAQILKTTPRILQYRINKLSITKYAE